jgi:hypothetical protein
VPTNIEAIGWCLQALLRCSTEDIGVSYRLVPANIVIIGWCLHDFIKKSFVVFSHLDFHAKSLCIVDYMFVCTFLFNCLWLVK